MTTEEAVAVRSGVQITSEIWIVTVDPKRHCESWAVFQDEQRARSYNEVWHDGAGTVEKRVVSGRACE